MDKNQALEELMIGLLQALLVKVRSKEVTAAELNVARQLLKDSNVEALSHEGTPLRELIDELPFDITPDFRG